MSEIDYKYHVIVLEDYIPAGRVLARAGERGYTYDNPAEDREIYLYREGKKTARELPSYLVRVERAEPI